MVILADSKITAKLDGSAGMRMVKPLRICPNFGNYVKPMPLLSGFLIYYLTDLGQFGVGLTNMCGCGAWQTMCIIMYIGGY